jgi:transcriptional regulator with XRE-family HTH domain
VKGEQIMYDVFVQLCQRDNVTPYVVSKATKIPASTFTDWKNGRSTPKIEKLQKIADFFDVSVDYLLTGKEDSVSDLFPHEDREFMYSRAEALHGMIAQMTRDGDARLIDLLYTFSRIDWTESRIKTLIGYATKLSDESRDFIDKFIDRELGSQKE